MSVSTRDHDYSQWENRSKAHQRNHTTFRPESSVPLFGSLYISTASAQTNQPILALPTSSFAADEIFPRHAPDTRRETDFCSLLTAQLSEAHAALNQAFQLFTENTYQVAARARLCRLHTGSGASSLPLREKMSQTKKLREWRLIGSVSGAALQINLHLWLQASRMSESMFPSHRSYHLELSR